MTAVPWRRSCTERMCTPPASFASPGAPTAWTAAWGCPRLRLRARGLRCLSPRRLDLGVRGMQEGAWRRLVVPAALGYGDAGLPSTETKSRKGVAPGADLFYEVRMMDAGSGRCDQLLRVERVRAARAGGIGGARRLPLPAPPPRRLGALARNLWRRWH